METSLRRSTRKRKRPQILILDNTKDDRYDTEEYDPSKIDELFDDDEEAILKEQKRQKMLDDLEDDYEPESEDEDTEEYITNEEEVEDEEDEDSIEQEEESGVPVDESDFVEEDSDYEYHNRCHAECSSTDDEESEVESVLDDEISED